jgi:phosphonate transport system permease protein
MRETSIGISWPTATGRPPASLVIPLVAVFVLLAVSAPLVEISPARIFSSLGRLAEFAGHFIIVPDWTYAGTVATKLFATIEMAFLGTTIAVVLSIPVGLLAARNATPHPAVSHGLRALLSLMRSLPEIMWALVFVSAVGLGPLPGVAALGFVTVGYLGKFLYEAIEAVPDAPVEGVAAHGANRMQIRFFALMPQAWPDFIATTFYVFEHNVRAATVLGLVGAGGIGYDMIMAMRLFQYDRLVLIVLAIYLAVTILDRLSDRLRRRVI